MALSRGYPSASHLSHRPEESVVVESYLHSKGNRRDHAYGRIEERARIVRGVRQVTV